MHQGAPPSAVVLHRALLKHHRRPCPAAPSRRPVPACCEGADSHAAAGALLGSCRRASHLEPHRVVDRHAWGRRTILLSESEVSQLQLRASSGPRTCGGRPDPSRAPAAGSSNGSSGTVRRVASRCQEVHAILQYTSQEAGRPVLHRKVCCSRFSAAAGSSAGGATVPAGGPGARQPQKLARAAHAPLSRSVSLPPRRHDTLSWIAACSGRCSLCACCWPEH